MIAFDPISGEVLRTVRESPNLIPELAIDGNGVLAIPDRDPLNPKLCLYRTAAQPDQSESLIWCISTRLPAFAVVALD